MAANRLANALFDVLDVLNNGGGVQTTGSNGSGQSGDNKTLADLRHLAAPLAAELERALASEGVVQTPVNVMFVSQASLCVFQ